jgi:hypothetical protein
VYEFEALAPAGLTMQLQIGGRTFTSSQPDHAIDRISVISVNPRTYWFGWPSPAQYSVESRFKDEGWDIRWGQMGFWLYSYASDPPITSAALPLTPPDLSEFSDPFYAVNHFYFWGRIDPHSEFFLVVGRLDSLQLVDSGVSSQQAVPEPDAWLVLAAFAVVVCFFVRVSRSNALVGTSYK